MITYFGTAILELGPGRLSATGDSVVFFLQLTTGL